jgi:23S rRNA pseudouridine1911/1915/1917 synthase
VKTGTQPHWTVAREDDGLRLDQFLAAPGRLGSRSRVRVALDRGKVFVNDVEASARQAGSLVTRGDVVRVWVDRPGSAKRRGLRTFDAPARQGSLSSGLPILYEDELLLVVNKPAGLLAVPLGRRKDAPSAFSIVSAHLGPRRHRRPFIVHRIDRDTSGLVVFAKTLAAQETMKDQFARREPERVYWAIVRGRPQPAAGRWRDRLAWDADALRQTKSDAAHPRATEAICDYRVLETFADASLVEVKLQTGKRNQIRVQASLRGHPLVGERQYRDGPPERADSLDSFPRQALHAHRLSFRHPADDRPLTFEAPLPDDLAGLLKRLRKSVNAS